MNRRWTRPGAILIGSGLALSLMVGCGASLPGGSTSERETQRGSLQSAGLGRRVAPSIKKPPDDTLAQALELPPSNPSDGLDGDRAAVEPARLPPLSSPPPTTQGKAIVIDQSLQMMGLFENGVEIRRMPVSTGRPTYDTYTRPWTSTIGHYVGSFESYTGGWADNAWFLYEATGAILIHSAPYYVEDGVKEYYDLDALGNYPASAGCVRLDPDDAQWFTEWEPQFVPFTITELPGPIEGLQSSG